MAKTGSAKSPSKVTKRKEPKEKRAASPYNIFMKNELAKVKKANPSLNHKEAFKVAAQNWAASSENPKNKK